MRSMEIRPGIGFYWNEDSYIRTEAPEKQAMVYILTNDLRCEVLEIPFLESQDSQEVEEAVNLHKKNLLLMFMLREYKYESELQLTESYVKSVREIFGPELPIIIFPYGHSKSHDLNEVEPNVFECQPHSEKLKQFIEQLIRNNQGILAEKKRLANPEMQALLNAYNTNFPDDENMFATPNDNSKITAEYLRIRLLPADQRKSEYDDTLPESISSNLESLSDAEKYEYARELEVIRNMNSKERDNFIFLIDLNWGRKRLIDGGISVERSCADSDVAGFAIDPDSLQTIITEGYGNHHIAGRFLADRLLANRSFREGNPFSHLVEDFKVEVVTGLLHKRVSQLPEFNIPIIELWINSDIDLQKVRRIGVFIISQRKMIPIDTEGFLVDENYTFK